MEPKRNRNRNRKNPSADTGTQTDAVVQGWQFWAISATHVTFRAIIETMATRRFRDAIASRDLSQIGAASISNLARNDALSLSVPSICVKVMSGSSDSAEVGPKYLTRNGGGGVGKRKRATDYHGFIFYLIRTTMTLA